MLFDPENPVNKLCAYGMQVEGEGRTVEAARIFNEAWQIALNSSEKFIAAHYVARHQHKITDKLKWDELALKHALAVNDEEMQSVYPSLYLNIGKDFEELGDNAKALENYRLAQSFASYLGDDGYGAMIRMGIEKGIERME